MATGTRRPAKHPHTILWNRLDGRWEVWHESREVAVSVDLDTCRDAYPDALVGPGPGSATPHSDEMP